MACFKATMAPWTLLVCLMVLVAKIQLCSTLCPAGLPLGSNVLLTARCQPGSPPSVTYTVQDRAAFLDDLGVVTVQYTCSDLPDTVETLINLAIDNERTATLPRTPAPGTECVFSGCTIAYLNPPGTTIPPVSCTIEEDECSTGKHNCDSNADCVDTVSGFECHCRAGYQGNGTHCTNIDECATGAHECGENTQCVDTEGSYNCTCKPGFEKDGDNCTNIDECRLGTHNCTGDTTCQDTIGGYVCQALVINDENEGSGVVDVIECLRKCSDFATCKQTKRGNRCICNEGFLGNGRRCKPLSSNCTER